MTVVKLEARGSSMRVASDSRVYPPCQELVAEHGDVKYIILPTASGLNKGLRRSLRQKLPNVQVFVAPNQWSFPLNLPLSWLDFRETDSGAPRDSADAPCLGLTTRCWTSISDGVVRKWFFHKRRTLLVTDSVLSVPEDPPAIVQRTVSLIVSRNDGDRRGQPGKPPKGWQRISLFAFT